MLLHIVSGLIITQIVVETRLITCFTIKYSPWINVLPVYKSL
jgi:hypothetical protein